jgi:dinuclear metal center YbgI/SA1388 family protein
MRCDDLYAYLDRLFDFRRWAEKDGNASGLQVARLGTEVDRVAFAVDACQETIEAAGAAGAQVLVVHHGLLWGREQPLTGIHHRRIHRLCALDLALVGIHLPLDAHPEVGNNIGIVKALGIAEPQPFGIYKGVAIGWKGVLPQPMSLPEIAARVTGGGEPIRLLPSGPDPIRSVAVVSGGATNEVRQAIAEGLDCYVTGDANHAIVHEAREARINLVFGGHYLTETWGVRQLAARLAQDTGLATTFIDVPTGL